MGTAIKQRGWALGCALALLVCVPLVRPWAAMGTVDDPSYARSAQLLAETGHILYNGWAAPILGWHLYWGALFIKLFGFSFNVLRMSTLVVSMLSAYVSQRAMVRCGLTEWNATLATLTLVLSPLFVPLTFSYMTDIGGYFVLVLCFYACVRSLEAQTEAQACWWIALAAISNAVGGTVRQTGWLGLLVMVPCTLWLLRGRRRVLLCGLVCVVTGIAFMVGAMEWYKHQPRIMPEPIWRGDVTKDAIRAVVRTMVRTVFDGFLFVLPVLPAFLPRLRWAERRRWAWTAVGAAALCGFLLLVQPQPWAWLEPTIGTYVSASGVIADTEVHGLRPVVLSNGVRLVLTVLVVIGIGAMFSAIAVARASAARREVGDRPLPWRWLMLLSAPFAGVYIGLMMSRASVNMVFDRYLLPLLFLLLLFMARAYQERISRQLPHYGWVVLAIAAIFSVGATHDAFAMLRARLRAIDELRARGVPATAIDGGWEFNSWTALNGPGYLLPYEGSDRSSEPRSDSTKAPCVPSFAASLPGLRAEYTLTTVPNGCGGQVGLPAVQYRQWFGARQVTLYIVRSGEMRLEMQTKR